MNQERTPEELANYVLDKLRKRDGSLSFPIDPFKLLKDEGVIVVLKEFEKLDGIIINDEDDVTIVGINYKTQWQRQRFTAAHEYCHFIKDLKKTAGESDVIQCLKNSSAKIERYADSFASYLLMPTEELKKVCEQYKNSEGYVSFEDITVIAEYFGVSFSACLNSVAYVLNLIDGDISPEALRERKKSYRPSVKRQQMIENKIDSTLLSNMINSLDYFMRDLSNYTGRKFMQNYIYNDNKLEGVSIERSELNLILADLNYNKESSRFFQSTDENVVMTLGNLELQEYVNNTSDALSIKDCRKLHGLLFKYVPYPENNGKYRTGMAMIRRGTIQPVSYTEIPERIEELDRELQYFMEKIDSYNIGEYIEQVAYFIYKFIVIHPFSDGNGRISRALLNWLLRKRNIPPIYIDDGCRDEYYKALSEIDVHENYIPFIMFIEKRIVNTLLEIHKYLFVDEIDEFDVIENGEEVAYVA